MDIQPQTKPRLRWGGKIVIAVLLLLGLLALRNCMQRGHRLVYRATPANEANLTTYVNAALTFVMLHETGHMMINELHLPMLGPEEDAADRFAVASLTNITNDDPALAKRTAEDELALASAGIFFDGMYQESVANHEEPSWADEHGLPEQRAYTIVCMLYGRDPDRFAKLADQVRLPNGRRASCFDETARNKAAWQSVLRPALDRADATAPFTGPTVGVFYHPVDETLAEPLRSQLIHGMERAKASHALERAADIMRRVPYPQSYLDKMLQYPRPPHQPDRDLRILMNRPLQPGDEDYRESLETYRVVGDPCLDGKKGVIVNAMWEADTRTITLCYAMVGWIENIGKTELARADLAKADAR